VDKVGVVRPGCMCSWGVVEDGEEEEGSGWAILSTSKTPSKELGSEESVLGGGENVVACPDGVVPEVCGSELEIQFLVRVVGVHLGVVGQGGGVGVGPCGVESKESGHDGFRSSDTYRSFAETVFGHDALSNSLVEVLDGCGSCGRAEGPKVVGCVLVDTSNEVS